MEFGITSLHNMQYPLLQSGRMRRLAAKVKN